LWKEKKKIQELQNLLNYEINNISKWMSSNQLTIIPNKSSILVIQPTTRGIPIEIQAHIEGQRINSIENTMYVSIVLDQYLNFNLHIEKITSKIAKPTGILWKQRKFLPAKTLLNLYYALIYPHLLYGLIVWDSIVSCVSQQNLQLVQNNAVRAIAGIKKYENITPSFKKIGVFKIHDSCKLEIAIYVPKYHNSKLPITFENYFTKSSNIHKYSTRSNEQLTHYIPKFRLIRLQKSFHYEGVKIWNSIETNLKSMSIIKFTTAYKNQLLEAYSTT